MLSINQRKVNIKRFLISLITIFLLAVIISGCSEKSTEPGLTVATPVFNISSGTYSQIQTVIITCETEGAEIRYTTDGSNPTLSSTQYTEPLVIDSDMTLKARAFKENWNMSEIATLNLVIDLEFVPQSIEFVIMTDVFSVDESYIVRVLVLDDNEDIAPNGTPVKFTATAGFFVDDISIGFTEYGLAAVTWNSGTTAGEATITATLGEISEVNEILIMPGNPDSITLTGEQSQDGINWEPIPDVGIPVNHPYEIRIKGEIQDRFNNPVGAGYRFDFATTLGEIEPFSDTDEAGTVYSSFHPGSTPGTAEISAISSEPVGEGGEYINDTLEIAVYSDAVYTISFEEQGTVYLDLQGTGGVDMIPLVVNLLDFNGDPVVGMHQVQYEILEPALEGVSINNAGLSDVVTSVDGVASADLYSGTEPGNIRVRVSLLSNPSINTTKYNIFIMSPPHIIIIFAPDIDSAVSLGNGVWALQLKAMIRDQFFNPVLDGTEVQFSLGSDPVPPASCYIQPTLSETVDGFAETFIYYHGEHSLSQVNIVVNAGDVSNTELTTLPVIQPQLVMSVSPQILEFTPGGATELDATVIAVLRDGQLNPISKAQINIVSTHGVFQYYEWFDDNNNTINDPANPNLIRTYNGEARGTIRILNWELPPPGGEDDFTEIEVLIDGLLVNTSVSDQIILTVRRWE